MSLSATTANYVCMERRWLWVGVWVLC